MSMHPAEQKAVDVNTEIKSGTWVTMITPFTRANELDHAGVKALVEWYARKGMDGIFAVCQSSEMFYLSLRERVELARTVMTAASGQLPVIISGHVSESLKDQVLELRAMAELNPEAVVLVSNRLARADQGDSVWMANAEHVLEAIPDVNFGIYECPHPYKRLMSPELLRWCAETGRFTFLKDTCGNIDQMREKAVAVAHTRLKLFNANSATLLDSLYAGYAGFSGVMLNFHPELYGWLCRNWQTQPEEAARLQHFATVASLIELQMYPVNAKYHMMLDGVPIGYETRSRNAEAFDTLKKQETEHLYRLWRAFGMPQAPIHKTKG